MAEEDGFISTWVNQRASTFSAVSSLTFARDGALLVIGDADGSVRLWDVERGLSRGVLWRGSVGVTFGSWYEEESDSVWIVAGTQLWNYDNLEPNEKKLIL